MFKLWMNRQKFLDGVESQIMFALQIIKIELCAK
jgi:hypothetical protein